METEGTTHAREPSQPIRNEETHERAGQGQQQGFGQKFPGQTCRVRTQSHANAEFLPAGGDACQQEVGDIGTDDQQHQAAGAQQDGDGRQQNVLRAKVRFPEGQHVGSDSLIAVGVGLGHQGCQGFGLSPRLFDRDSQA